MNARCKSRMQPSPLFPPSKSQSQTFLSRPSPSTADPVKHHFHWSMTEALKKALRSNLDDRVPFIEFPCPGIKTIDELKSPRILKSHLPLQLLPPSALQTPSVKIIYVTRNPRDVAVSLYHFMDMLTEVQREKLDFLI